MAVFYRRFARMPAAGTSADSNTSAYVSIRQHTSADSNTSAYVSIRQHASRKYEVFESVLFFFSYYGTEKCRVSGLLDGCS